MKETQQTPPQPYSEWRHEPDIPYKIRCNFNMSDTMLLGEIPLDQHHPARFLKTPDLPGPDESISMFFHHSIPQEFLEFVYYHEKTEAAAVHGDKQLSKEEAHQLAVTATKEYIVKTQGKSLFKKFDTWAASLSQ